VIDEKRVMELASLAKFRIEEEKTDEFKGYLNVMIDNLKEIKDLDLENIEINYHVNGDINALAEDEIKESLPREEVIKNTVESQYGYFKILKVVD
jgi:aspartyl-tRNA(Asn)/glutamyl-tRNA(Gln) amidotransferase subunit C